MNNKLNKIFKFIIFTNNLKYQFDLPIEVKYGKIGRLKVTLPVKNYYKEPAKIIAEDLFVLLGPFEENIYDQKRVDEIFTALSVINRDAF